MIGNFAEGKEVVVVVQLGIACPLRGRRRDLLSAEIDVVARTEGHQRRQLLEWEGRTLWFFGNVTDTMSRGGCVYRLISSLHLDGTPLPLREAWLKGAHDDEQGAHGERWHPRSRRASSLLRPHDTDRENQEGHRQHGSHEEDHTRRGEAARTIRGRAITIKHASFTGVLRVQCADRQPPPLRAVTAGFELRFRGQAEVELGRDAAVWWRRRGPGSAPADPGRR